MTEENKDPLDILYEAIEEYREHSKCDGYYFSIDEFDKLYEDIMAVLGAYDEKKSEHKDAKKWSKRAHKIHNICWDFYINKCKEYLKHTHYYAKYYTNEEEENGSKKGQES